MSAGGPDTRPRRWRISRSACGSSPGARWWTSRRARASSRASWCAPARRSSPWSRCAEMRAELPPQAIALEGTAEAIPLDDASADAVTVAQAFHWFDAEPALAEIHRVLRPGGALALVWNERHEDDPVNQAIDALVDPLRRESGVPQYRDGSWRAAFERSRLFGPAQGGAPPQRAGPRRRRPGRPRGLGELREPPSSPPAGRPCSHACAPWPRRAGGAALHHAGAGLSAPRGGLSPMESRLTLVTLGVRDLARARAFYEALGWRNRASEGAGRRLLPVRRDGARPLGSRPPRRGQQDAGRRRLGRGHARPQRALARGGGCGAGRGARRRGLGAPRGRAHGVGRLLGPVRRPGRTPLGGGPQPGLGAQRGPWFFPERHGCGAGPTDWARSAGPPTLRCTGHAPDRRAASRLAPSTRALVSCAHRARPRTPGSPRPGGRTSVRSDS